MEKVQAFVVDTNITSADARLDLYSYLCLYVEFTISQLGLPVRLFRQKCKEA
jgi:hypothetical protein